jgi:uncharacterized membrane protein YGL010W
MKSLEEQMGFYAAYHQDPRNKATHFVGVPVIMLSLFIPLGWLRLELGSITVTGAIVLAAIVLAYYLMLDVPLALAAAVVTAVLVYIGNLMALQPISVGITWFLVLFVGGWILQLIGHSFEGRKPALTANLFQIFVAPIFLCAEAFFALGYKPGLHSATQRRALELRASAGLPQERHT